MTWTTLVGVSPLVVRDGRLLMIRQRRPYGVHWERPQTEEDIDAAAYVDPYALEDAELHPICFAILDRWWTTLETGFHIVAEALPQPDGTQRYEFRT